MTHSRSHIGILTMHHRGGGVTQYRSFISFIVVTQYKSFNYYFIVVTQYKADHI